MVVCALMVYGSNCVQLFNLKIRCFESISKLCAFSNVLNLKKSNTLITFFIDAKYLTPLVLWLYVDKNIRNCFLKPFIHGFGFFVG